MISIAEKINATIPSMKKIIDLRDTEKLLEVARQQTTAGADYLDVNVGTGSGDQADEIEAMRWAVTALHNEVETPLCIDSADPTVLRAGLEAHGDRPGLINSTKGSDKYLEAVVPLAKEFNKPIVGLAMDEEGIPKTVEKRVAACGRIVAACEQHGIGPENIFFDPLVLPVSTDINQGIVTLETIKALKQEFPGTKTVMALSNISFGLPKRRVFNVAFLHMALLYGLDAAICNVMDTELMGAAKTAEAILGKDRHCRKYARFWRKNS